jgi:hypothetical protein
LGLDKLNILDFILSLDLWVLLIVAVIIIGLVPGGIFIVAFLGFILFLLGYFSW